MSEEFEDAKTYGITCITWAVREGALEKAAEYNVYVCILDILRHAYYYLVLEKNI